MAESADRLLGFAARGLDELALQAFIRLLPLIDDTLVLHELLLQKLNSMLETRIWAIVACILGADKSGLCAADVMRAGLKKWQIAQAMFLVIAAIDHTDVFIDLSGGKKLLNCGYIGGAVEIVVRHFDEPVHLKFWNHRGP